MGILDDEDFDVHREFLLQENRLTRQDRKYLACKKAGKAYEFGSGAFATVFGTEDLNYVFKFTRDFTDAKNAAKLRRLQQLGEKTPFFPRILSEVYTYKAPTNSSRIFFYISEKLKEINYDQSEDFICGVKKHRSHFDTKWYRQGVKAREYLKKNGMLGILRDVTVSHNNMLDQKEKHVIFNDFGFYNFKLPDGKVIRVNSKDRWGIPRKNRTET